MSKYELLKPITKVIAIKLEEYRARLKLLGKFEKTLLDSLNDGIYTIDEYKFAIQDVEEERKIILENLKELRDR